MSLDLDDRARRAAENLRASVDGAPLLLAQRTSNPGRRLSAALRPAWVAAALILGSAVGFAFVAEPTAVEPRSSTTTTTTPIPTTTTATTAAAAASTTTVTAASPVVDVTPPPLTITSPEDGSTMEEKTVEFVGVTEAGATVTAGPYQAQVDEEGNWRITLVLSAGGNQARFVARDAAGNQTTVVITVFYEPPVTTTVPATTTTTKQDLAEFDANATYESCTEDPPFDVYYGVGEPGSTIYVVSPYGSGTTTVNGEGHFEIQVFFPGAPPEEGFLVKVKDQYGRQESFEFVFLPGI
jgi:Glucodextranase, domain B